jgi:hypothetical protein
MCAQATETRDESVRIVDVSAAVEYGKKVYIDTYTQSHTMWERAHSPAASPRGGQLATVISEGPRGNKYSHNHNHNHNHKSSAGAPPPPSEVSAGGLSSPKTDEPNIPNGSKHDTPGTNTNDKLMLSQRFSDRAPTGSGDFAMLSDVEDISLEKFSTLKEINPMQLLGLKRSPDADTLKIMAKRTPAEAWTDGRREGAPTELLQQPRLKANPLQDIHDADELDDIYHGAAKAKGLGDLEVSMEDRGVFRRRTRSDSSSGLPPTRPGQVACVTSSTSLRTDLNLSDILKATHQGKAGKIGKETESPRSDSSEEPTNAFCLRVFSLSAPPSSSQSNASTNISTPPTRTSASSKKKISPPFARPEILESRRVHTAQQVSDLVEHISAAYSTIQTLEEQKKHFAKQIKAWNLAFEREYGRAPTAAERKMHFKQSYVEYEQVSSVIVSKQEKIDAFMKSVNLSFADYKKLRDRLSGDWISDEWDKFESESAQEAEGETGVDVDVDVHPASEADRSVRAESGHSESKEAGEGRPVGTAQTDFVSHTIIQDAFARTLAGAARGGREVVTGAEPPPLGLPEPAAPHPDPRAQAQAQAQTQTQRPKASKQLKPSERWNEQLLRNESRAAQIIEEVGQYEPGEHVATGDDNVDDHD